MTGIITITSNDLDKIRSFIYNEAGIYYEEKKNQYLLKRLRIRIHATRSATFLDYYTNHLLCDANEEVSHFIQEITVNETYFFRDFPQLQGFAEIILPEYIEKKKKCADNTLKIWSAACSTGEEPYTLSIILQEMIEDYKKWEINILGTDIDEKALSNAIHGVYSERSIRETPIIYRDKYLSRSGENWYARNSCKRFVKFENLNLMSALGMRSKVMFDFIFCRNVLIYFDDASRKKVLDHFYNSLQPGGYIFLGHSESVGRITSAFTLERHGSFMCYKKPLSRKQR